MNQETDNTEKRKTTPLTNSEAALFFFLPLGFFGINKTKSTEFNESELERFKRYNFDLKLKQAREMKIGGIIFYLSLMIIIAYFLQ